ncbi:hypothetical protein K440DRAFT_636193 [Wilcoxina mikolae CBS 423.85]|nr:hypothetical protein K440DRAFT_636193 [Wilcoxina mikolae CBS 423.85]
MTPLYNGVNSPPRSESPQKKHLVHLRNAPSKSNFAHLEHPQGTQFRLYFSPIALARITPVATILSTTMSSGGGTNDQSTVNSHNTAGRDNTINSRNTTTANSNNTTTTNRKNTTDNSRTYKDSEHNEFTNSTFHGG